MVVALVALLFPCLQGGDARRGVDVGRDDGRRRVTQEVVQEVPGGVGTGVPLARTVRPQTDCQGCGLVRVRSGLDLTIDLESTFADTGSCSRKKSVRTLRLEEDRAAVNRGSEA